jgi:hypothetical protein
MLPQRQCELWIVGPALWSGRGAGGQPSGGASGPGRCAKPWMAVGATSEVCAMVAQTPEGGRSSVVLTHLIRNHTGKTPIGRAGGARPARDHTPEKIVAVVGCTA